MLCSNQFKMEFRFGSVHCKFRRGKRCLPENVLKGGQGLTLRTSIKVNITHIKGIALF